MPRVDVTAEQAPPGKRHVGSSPVMDQRTPGQPDPLIGMRVNGFAIRRKLAEGGMSAVYVVQHERLTNIHKVIKVLLPTYAQNACLRQRFEREAESVSRLDHEHILRIDNFGSLPDGQLWLMTEFLHGQPLDEFLRIHRRLTEHRALLMILQLCSALEHAHGAGIIHRDLKPGNVFVCPTSAQPYAIRLLDFGIAKILHTASDGASARTGVPIGTPSYMAVEQYDHADEVTPRADIFSLAVMTHEMVTGRLPWGRHDQAVLYHKQRTERPPLDGLSPGWKRVLQDALAVEPTDRPESARAYAVALASETPAIPPYLPGGVEMLRTIAPDLMDSAARDHETVRDPSNRDSIAPMAWAMLTPPEVPPAQATTSHASTASIVGEPPRRLARGKLVLAGLVACGLAGLVTFTIVCSLRSCSATARPLIPGATSDAATFAAAIRTMAWSRSRPCFTPRKPSWSGPCSTTPRPSSPVSPIRPRAAIWRIRALWRSPPAP